MVLYVNPKGELRRWDKYNVLPTINSEVAVFKDMDGDGKPDAVFLGGGTVCWAGADPANPTAPWIVHPVSEPGYGVVAQHGIGAGDINGDGRMISSRRTVGGSSLRRARRPGHGLIIR